MKYSSVEVCAFVVSTLSIFTFIVLLVSGEVSLGWLTTAIWLFLYGIKR